VEDYVLYSVRRTTSQKRTDQLVKFRTKLAFTVQDSGVVFTDISSSTASDDVALCSVAVGKLTFMVFRNDI